MRENVCCLFGHREVYEEIDEILYNEVCRMIVENGVDVFLVGGHGRFDSIATSVVNKVKKTFPNVKLILVRPYLTKELNVNRVYYNTTYDEIIIPSALANVHYRTAIPKRNCWMIDKSKYVIAYLRKNYGGVYVAVQYAEKQNRTIVRI
jgi:uncharacterized phage-like protein YoqJ